MAPKQPRPECACGCGERVTNLRATWVKGHDKRTWDMRVPNPGGMCMCGCGQPAPLADRTDPSRSCVKGKPLMYVRGHYGRIPPPVEDENGCLIWQGRPGNHGRGLSHAGGRQELAYRAAYTAAKGAIPEGHHLHHTCENPRCVNVEHLVPMTPSEHSLLHAAARKAA